MLPTRTSVGVVVYDIFRARSVIISTVRVRSTRACDAIVFQHESRISLEDLSRRDTPRRWGVIANLCQLDILWKIFELFIALLRQSSPVFGVPSRTLGKT